jgi:hypothetical protein
VGHWKWQSANCYSPGLSPGSLNKIFSCWVFSPGCKRLITQDSSVSSSGAYTSFGLFVPGSCGGFFPCFVLPARMPATGGQWNLTSIKAFAVDGQEEICPANIGVTCVCGLLEEAATNCYLPGSSPGSPSRTTRCLFSF